MSDKSNKNEDGCFVVTTTTLLPLIVGSLYFFGVPLALELIIALAVLLISIAWGIFMFRKKDKS